MSRLLLYLVAAAVLGSTVLFRGTREDIVEGERQIISYASKAIARSIAQTGVAFAEQTYYHDFNANGSYTGSGEISGHYQGGVYTAQINNAGEVTSLRVVGKYMNASYTIERLYGESVEENVKLIRSREW